MTTLPAPLQKIADDLAAARARLVAALSGLDDAQTMKAPGPDNWNAAQIVDHLMLAEGFTNDITKMLAGNAPATGFPSDLAEFDPLPEARSMEAPPPIRPRQELPAAELITALEAMGVRTQGSFETLANVDPRAFSMEHPLFGPLDLGQWWAIHPMHYDMHIAQAQGALGS